MGLVYLIVGSLFFLFAGLGGYFLYQARNERTARLALQSSGITSEATIISQRSESHTYQTKSAVHHHTDYYLTYEYETPGGSVTHEEKVDYSDYQRLTQGTKVKVTYLPNDPDTVRLASEAADLQGTQIMAVFSYVMFGIAGVVALGGGAVIISLSNLAAQSAQAAQATATAVSTARRAELAAIRPVIDPQLSQWQTEPGMAFHQLYPFKTNADIKPTIQEVDYGHCTDSSDGTQFYAFVWTSVSQANGQWSREGFGYYSDTAAYIDVCHPENWIIWDHEDLGGGWHSISAQSDVTTPVNTQE